MLQFKEEIGGICEIIEEEHRFDFGEIKTISGNYKEMREELNGFKHLRVDCQSFNDKERPHESREPKIPKVNDDHCADNVGKVISQDVDNFIENSYLLGDKWREEQEMLDANKAALIDIENRQSLLVSRLHEGVFKLETILRTGALEKVYRDAALATLTVLEERCSQVAKELSKLNDKIVATSDIASLRQEAMVHASSIARQVVSILIDGATESDPSKWGKTCKEERAANGVGKWPGLLVDVFLANVALKLYGRAAFERVLNEVCCAPCSIECRPVANILLAQIGREGVASAAAIGIARAFTCSWLGPLLDTSCERLAYVLQNLFELVVERSHTQESCKGYKLAMIDYASFHTSLRLAYDQSVRNLASRCNELVRHHLEALISPFSHIHGFECSFKVINRPLPDMSQSIRHHLDVFSHDSKDAAPLSVLQSLGALTTPIRKPDIAKKPLREC
ncbi:hypothetical protein L7F22_007116 [Adiantum nelumboides]|nr:hypothetical protein [Adiantum nelumboides]MCO5553591.1 hypothetical protein [Adiantum nelumboides]